MHLDLIADDLDTAVEEVCSHGRSPVPDEKQCQGAVGK